MSPIPVSATPSETLATGFERPERVVHELLPLGIGDLFRHVEAAVWVSRRIERRPHALTVERGVLRADDIPGLEPRLPSLLDQHLPKPAAASELCAQPVGQPLAPPQQAAVSRQIAIPPAVRSTSSGSGSEVREKHAIRADLAATVARTASKSVDAVSTLDYPSDSVFDLSCGLALRGRMVNSG
jgi:hypothetical protein